ncbi:MAG: Crp/Fnr family transcriptional regulator [Flavobacteriales bacterium]|nr:Crp/Fnr family transcriptional regulator [Flavobacteriales bacterium]
MKDHLKSFNILTEEEIDSFQDLIVPKSLKKGEFFITEGKTCKQIAFIVSGLFRSFYYSSEEEDVTYCLTFENSFLTAYSSFITQLPTDENIQALSDVDLLVISKEKIDQLESSSVNWLRLFKLIAENEYLKMEKRVFMLQRESAETRYLDLIENHPKYLNSVPLNYLASYLGITPRHLSRIRKSISL